MDVKPPGNPHRIMAHPMEGKFSRLQRKAVEAVAAADAREMKRSLAHRSFSFVWDSERLELVLEQSTDDEQGQGHVRGQERMLGERPRVAADGCGGSDFTEAEVCEAIATAREGDDRCQAGAGSTSAAALQGTGTERRASDRSTLGSLYDAATVLRGVVEGGSEEGARVILRNHGLLALVRLLRSGDASLEEDAVISLLGMLQHERLRGVLTDQGLLIPLVDCLKRTKIPSTRANLAAALSLLTRSETQTWSLLTSGAVEVLVDVLRDAQRMVNEKARREERARAQEEASNAAATQDRDEEEEGQGNEEAWGIGGAWGAQVDDVGPPQQPKLAAGEERGAPESCLESEPGDAGGGEGDEPAQGQGQGLRSSEERGIKGEGTKDKGIAEEGTKESCIGEEGAKEEDLTVPGIEEEAEPLDASLPVKCASASEAEADAASLPSEAADAVTRSASAPLEDVGDASTLSSPGPGEATPALAPPTTAKAGAPDAGKLARGLGLGTGSRSLRRGVLFCPSLSSAGDESVHDACLALMHLARFRTVRKALLRLGTVPVLTDLARVAGIVNSEHSIAALFQLLARVDGGPEAICIEGEGGAAEALLFLAEDGMEATQEMALDALIAAASGSRTCARALRRRAFGRRLTQSASLAAASQDVKGKVSVAIDIITR